MDRRPWWLRLDPTQHAEAWEWHCRIEGISEREAHARRERDMPKPPLPPAPPQPAPATLDDMHHKDLEALADVVSDAIKMALKPLQADIAKLRKDTDELREKIDPPLQARLDKIEQQLASIAGNRLSIVA